MSHPFVINKTTNVAFLDVAQAAPNAKIRVIDVSDAMGLRSQVLARVDTENKILLGLIVEHYKAFRSEVRRKYVAWHIERITELLLCSIRDIVTQPSNSDRHHLATA